MVEQLLLNQILQYVDMVDDIAGFGVDRPLDGHIHLVVMPVVVGIAADTEDLLIPFVGARRIIETVRHIEMDAPMTAARGIDQSSQSGGRCQRPPGVKPERPDHNNEAPTRAAPRSNYGDIGGFIEARRDAWRPSPWRLSSPRSMTCHGIWALHRTCWLNNVLTMPSMLKMNSIRRQSRLWRS